MTLKLSTFDLLILGGAMATAPAAALAQERAEQPAEVEEIVVQATRSGRLVQDEPIRVEVLDREEVEEKLMMTPGDIAMMVAETGGVRVQVTSPALGAANIRMQGMSGRYTQLLADGLPLYGGQSSSLGLLQIPPTDLGQVEVIKGAASALYGPSALGGVINLVSRRPHAEAEGELLANVTSRNGQDLTAYGATAATGDWSASITGGLHRQSRRDLDGDGWADMAGYERWTVRPRLFWNGRDGATLYATLGAMGETRDGGTLPGRATPDGQPFPQAQDTRRYDGGLVAEWPVEGLGALHFRASGMTQTQDQRFGSVIENDRNDTLFAEGSVSGKVGGTSLLGGLAIQRDSFRSKTFPAFDYAYASPALFAQVEHDLRDDVTVAGSARLDVHSEYGTQFSPRLSALYRPGPWTVRASLGRGFYAPTPFVEDVQAAGLSRLEPLSGLKAETADTASLDGGYASGPIEASLTLFASNIRNAVRLEDVGPQSVRLINAPGDTRTRGAEMLLRYRWRDFSVTGSYVYADASEPDLPGRGRRAVPLTPRNTGGLVATWEKPGKGRIGLEAYYTGRQALEDDPYRAEGKPYFELGALGELIVGKVSLFVNMENLLNIRQTKYDSLVLPRRAPDGQWTVDAWGPTNGFVVNAALRWRFGG